MVLTSNEWSAGLLLKVCWPFSSFSTSFVLGGIPRIPYRFLATSLIIGNSPSYCVRTVIGVICRLLGILIKLLLACFFIGHKFSYFVSHFRHFVLILILILVALRLYFGLGRSFGLDFAQVSRLPLFSSNCLYLGFTRQSLFFKAYPCLLVAFSANMGVGVAPLCFLLDG